MPLEKVMSSQMQQKDAQVWFRGHRVWISHLATKFGVNRSVIRNRIKNGWSIEDAVTKEVVPGHTRLVEYGGERNSIKYFAKKLGLRYVRLCELIRAGRTVEEAIKDMKK